MKYCTVKGCKNKPQRRGMCAKHHTKAYYAYLDGNNDPRFSNYTGNSPIPNMNGLGSTWIGMVSRCYKPTNPGYKYYGGRGIKICDAWLSDPSLFYDEIGPRPSDDYSVDRINNDGDYEPGNVRWATKMEQSCNRRIKNPNGHPGIGRIVRKCGKIKWRVELYSNHRNNHIGYFDSLDEAIQARKKAELQYLSDHL
jgi:hypothetical protein